MDDQIQRQSFEIADPKLAHALFGQQNRHLRQIEKLTGVKASSKRGRPSKAEKAAHLKEIAEEKELIREEAERLGFKVVK